MKTVKTTIRDRKFKSLSLPVALLLLLIGGFLLQGCASASSSPLGSNRHVVEVHGAFTNAGVLYTKWEQKAYNVCNGPYTVIERDYESAENTNSVVGTIECN